MGISEDLWLTPLLPPKIPLNFCFTCFNGMFNINSLLAFLSCFLSFSVLFSFLFSSCVILQLLDFELTTFNMNWI